MLYNTNLLIVYSAFFGHKVGGSLKDSFKVVLGLKTLPAVLALGRPFPPITDSDGFQILFIYA
jgi:hypothetical protein